MTMKFENAGFIKSTIPYEKAYKNHSPAPMFRRKFHIKDIKGAKLHICALGFGYCWINGKRVSSDLFTAPVSDYNKTLWFNTYDISDLLQEGENIAAVICGNGWYNESFETPWGHNNASWRDNPKFLLRIEANEKTVLVSDDSWRCSDHSPIIFNHLRSGEYFDSRLYNENWNKLEFDDSEWDWAVADEAPPNGTLREYDCEPVRECGEYTTKEIIQVGVKKYLFDIGQNISGYIRLKIKQNAGDELVIRYAEQLNPDHSLKLNKMEEFYPESPFQTDRFICNGEAFTWSPMFAYHGFRYIEITGLEQADPSTVCGIFVHLDVDQLSDFACSDPFLNYLFRIGQMATLSNLQHIPTDCPTREKLGWANDAQASAEQMLMNFNTHRFFKKWLVDIIDSMNSDGELPGIIPTCGWGYEWGTGPVSSGALFEIPYKIYLYTGDDAPLKECFPAFIKHLTYIAEKAGTDGLMDYGLCDWAGPFEPFGTSPVPVKFINGVYYIKFLKIALFSAGLTENNEKKEQLQNELERFEALFKMTYLNTDGTCTIDEQTSAAMLIYHGIYNTLEPLANQLVSLVEKKDFHHECGMVGLRHLYHALNICGKQEYAYRIVTAWGYPSYRVWAEKGATTLWETWQPGASKNHHMYSDFMLWFMTTLVGIMPIMENPGFCEVRIDPCFLSEIDYCKGSRKTPNGTIEVSWVRNVESILLNITIPHGTQGRYQGQILKHGNYHFELH